MNREDLFRYRRDLQHFNSQLEDIEIEMERLCGTTPQYSENFGGKGTKDKIGDGVAKLVDMKKEKDEKQKEIDRLKDVKQAVEEMRKISRKHAKFADILYEVYIKNYPKTLQQIANEWYRNGDRTYSYNHVTVLHRQALDEFDKLFKDR